MHVFEITPWIMNLQMFTNLLVPSFLGSLTLGDIKLASVGIMCGEPTYSRQGRLTHVYCRMSIIFYFV